MPISPTDVAPIIEEFLVRLALFFLIVGTAYSAVATVLVRWLGSRGLSLLWLLATAALAVLSVATNYPAMPVLSTAYTGGVFASVATGTASLAIWRIEAVRPHRMLIIKVLAGTGAFMVSLPVAALLASIPDLVRIMVR